ncbi:MAG: CvpA family protein [Planctomycetota bacterium]
MNPIDIAAIILIGFNLILGLMRGAVPQVIKILSIILGVWAAMRYGEVFRDNLPASFGLSDSAGLIIAQIVLFMSIYLVMFGISHLMRKLIQKAELRSMDRVLGGLLGAAKGIIYCCVLLYLQFIPFITEITGVKKQLYGSEAKNIDGSIANRIFISYLKDRIDSTIPDDLSKKVDNFVDDADRVVRPKPK